MILTVTPNPCVDKTVYIDRLAPGTFHRSTRTSCVPGGKGNNVARAAKALGAASKALVIVGGHSGRHVVDMITNDDGVPCVPCWVVSPTRTITTVLEEAEHRQTAFFEPGSRVTEAEYANLLEIYAEAVRDARIAVFSGTVCDRGIERFYREAIPMAQAAGALTILDSHGREFALGLEATPYMVKPNVAEAEELVGFRLDTEAARWRAVDCFHERGVTLAALSLGKDGLLVSRGDERYHVAPPEIREVNPVGSGDALVGGFAVGLERDMPLVEMARLGCACGAANAMTWDIGHFSMDEVREIERAVEVRPGPRSTA